MTEKRFHQFGLWVIDNPNFNGISIADLVDTELMSITEVVDLLNEQQATIEEWEFSFRTEMAHHRVAEDELKEKIDEQQVTIEQLQAKLKEKEEDEQLYANEIVKLNKEAKEVLDFKSLGGNY